MKAIKFRTANTKDSEQLANLRYQLYAEDCEATIPRIKYVNSAKKFFVKTIKDKNWVHFIAVDGNEVIGNFSLNIIKALPRPFADKKFIGYLTNAYVKPEYRNKNIGKKLIRNLLHKAEKLDCESVFLWPHDKAKTLYSRAGFQQTELCEIRFKK